MSYKILNNLFYPDITNIIIQYLLPDEIKMRREFKINRVYMDGVFTMMVPDSKHKILMQQFNMIKRVNKMLFRLDEFKCKKDT